jgi:hypothetical protein
MDDRLRTLMGTLRYLARYPNVNRLPLAERRIDEYLHLQQVSAWQSALERLRDIIGAEPRELPIDSEFWQSMEEYIATLGSPGL